MPATPETALMTDTERLVENAKDLVDDTKAIARKRVEGVEEELLSYAQRKPLTALLIAVGVGVLLGKTIL